MAQDRVNVRTKDPVVAIIEPSLKVGAACGGVGFLFGGTSGVLKNTTPFLFATASGIQTFALGTTYWGLRSSLLQAWDTGDRQPGDFIKASTIAGGLSGGLVALLTRGRSNVLPGTIMFSLFGCLGQATYNRFSDRPVESRPKEGFWRRMAQKSWSPVTVMTNEEYATMLREKLLKVDVEIAVLEDKIAALRVQQKQEDQHHNQTTKPNEG